MGERATSPARGWRYDITLNCALKCASQVDVLPAALSGTAPLLTFTPEEPYANTSAPPMENRVIRFHHFLWAGRMSAGRRSEVTGRGLCHLCDAQTTTSGITATGDSNPADRPGLKHEPRAWR